MKSKQFRILIAAFIFGFLAAHLALGQIVITGPTESLAGDLVVLQVSEATSGGPSGTEDKPLAYVWTVIPDDITTGKYRVCDDGKTLVFASRLEGTYHFILSAVDGSGVIAVKHQLDNKSLGPAPAPVPGPEPTPEPKPAPLPDPDHDAIGKYALEKAKELVKSQFFDREKNALGEAFLATVKQIESGTLETGEAARTGLRVNTATYLNSVSRDSADRWQAWNTALGDELARYKLDDLAAISKVYKTIGVSLATVSDPGCPDGKCNVPTPTRRRR